METVLPVTEDTTSSTDHAFTPNPTTPSPLTVDAKPGIGPTLSALPALISGWLTITASVCLLMISVGLPPPRAPANHATKATTFRMVLAYGRLPTMLPFLILVAKSGTGLPTPVRPALRTGTS